MEYLVKRKMLKEFLHEYLDGSGVEDAKSLPVDKFEHNIYCAKGLHSYVQYRDDTFQIQVFIFPPYGIVPEHVHPNVNSYEVGLSGDLWFSHGGKWLYPKHPALHYYKKNRCIKVDNNDIHGASIGEGGGMFISVQQWLNGVKPSCVGQDYEGYALTPDHEKNGIKFKDVHWKMAASKETTRRPPWIE